VFIIADMLFSDVTTVCSGSVCIVCHTRFVIDLLTYLLHCELHGAGIPPATYFFSTRVFTTFLQFHATDTTNLLITVDTLALTHSLFLLLVLIVISTRSS